MSTAVKCACPKCTCEVTEENAIVLQGKFFCSTSCSTGHPNNEPCHGEGSCGCKCGE
ncbi:MAG: conjugal transfer protein TrbI [Synechococcus sp. YX04-3]|nr:MAG: conjugal transfer protein TrbI [Synechococcus sp. YX04-3]